MDPTNNAQVVVGCSGRALDIAEFASDTSRPVQCPAYLGAHLDLLGPSSTIMIISKASRRTIYENLFKEGVLVAKKDFNAPKHEDLDVPNLEVIKAMQSLTSKGFVKTQFSWQYYYYSLTNEGIEYLREWLHLPAEIVPATHKKAARPPRPAGIRSGGEGAYRAPRGDRDEYRRRDAKEESGAPAEFRPRFGGVGRGQPVAA
ncbi:hypothetical protein BS47DRAFT_1342872 [Hydnum rufescens UP504]|uniref:Plectin/eS10 N-terminal domain-containing protein n=1 Tax=Hydnum rufescens UP504 TaxID=1448309 RepID=A0A9P6DX89_9AGAM|nr:hypothetical protein BS47DRAFT_1342872 [Hydnum rufescens UP504]